MWYAYMRIGEIAASMKRLWEFAGTRQVYDSRSCLTLSDSLAHFAAQLDYLIESLDDYVPSDSDYILDKIKTTGTVEYQFRTRQGNAFSIWDVGGQRSERSKACNRLNVEKMYRECKVILPDFLICVKETSCNTVSNTY